MPILDVDKAQNIIVLKRSMNPGFAGIDNPLYEDPEDHDALRRREEIHRKLNVGRQGLVALRRAYLVILSVATRSVAKSKDSDNR